MLVAHEATVPPSSHVFTIDKAPWAQNICGPDSLQIVEENYGYKLNVSITCGSINVTKLFSMIAEVSGATDYVANPAYYNISDGKLIQSPEGDWIFSKFDSSDRIDVNFSGNPDSYDFVLPAQDGSTHTVRLTKDQVTSVFAASLVSDGNGVDLGSTPTLEPLSIVTESIVEIPEALTVSPQVDSATSQEPSSKEVNNQSEYDFLLFIRGLWTPDEVTNMNVLEKLGSVFGLLLMIEIGKLMIVSGERFLNESDQVVGKKTKINTGNSEYDIPEARRLEKGQSRKPVASINPKSMSSKTTNSDSGLSPEFREHLAKCGIVLPTPEEKQQHIELLYSLSQIDNQNVGDDTKSSSRESLGSKKPTKPVGASVLSEEEEGRLKKSGINDILDSILKKHDSDNKK
jgi:hypothetical protein